MYKFDRKTEDRPGSLVLAIVDSHNMASELRIILCFEGEDYPIDFVFRASSVHDHNAPFFALKTFINHSELVRAAPISAKLRRTFEVMRRNSNAFLPNRKHSHNAWRFMISKELTGEEGAFYYLLTKQYRTPSRDELDALSEGLKEKNLRTGRLWLDKYRKATDVHFEAFDRAFLARMDADYISDRTRLWINGEDQFRRRLDNIFRALEIPVERISEIAPNGLAVEDQDGFRNLSNLLGKRINVRRFGSDENAFLISPTRG